MPTTTRLIVEKKKRKQPPRGAAAVHEIVVCDCPVCHPAGARKLLTALATAIGNSRDHSDTTPVIRLKMAPLDGVCFEGPDIAVDGVRHATFRNEDVLALVRKLHG